MTAVDAHPVCVFPASFAQVRLWFFDRLNPGSAAYVSDVPLRVRGSLDAAALGIALNDVVARHEMLRTTFSTVDEEAVQVVHDQLPVVMERQDLRGRPDPLGDAKVLAQRLATTGFDLSRGPLIRVTVAHLADDDWAVLLAVHHIVVDGWSLGVLLNELRDCYVARAAGRQPELAPLPLQYGDFAVWQRRHMTGTRLDSQLDYWRNRLHEAPRLALPTDRPRPQISSHRGAREHVTVPASVVAGLRDIAMAENATMFMCLLAAYGALLRTWSGEHDVVVGTPIAGRDQAEIEALIGFFVNTVALRMDLRGQPTFRDVVRRARLAVLDAFSHQDLPFERLVSELAPDRELGHSPFFDTTFALQNAGAPQDWPGLDLTTLAIPHETVKFDLALTCAEVGDQLTARFAYATELFDAARIKRMAGHFATLLASAVHQPDIPIGQLTLLTEPERTELARFNASAMPIPDRCVHELFAEQAARAPDACAIDFGTGTLSYREVDERSERLAHLLQAAGVNGDRPVAVVLDHGPDLLAAELAVWKAGAAFIPVDVATPPYRIAATLERARPLVAVTSSEFAALLPRGPTPILVDRLPLTIQLPPYRRPKTTTRSLAYLIATSGTTGVPKLVEIEHRSLVNHLAWVAESVLTDPQLALPALSSPAFDAAHKQLIGPLLRGGTVWMLPPADRLDPRRLLAALAARPRAALNCVPTLWEAILEHIESGRVGKPPSLVQLMLGGEQLTEELVARTFAAFPSIVLWNLYGPTEATVNALAVRIRPGDEVTIGRPVANVGCDVLDQDGAVLPIGIPGELCLSGIALARGYHDDPVATARAFEGPPDRPGSRRYRTGDQVVRTADGRIRFLGRLDDEVKVRGVRVKLGEIVAHLRAHPAVRDAAVVLRDGQLAAYVVPAAAAPAPGELRGYLKARLHPATVPSAFTVLAALPLTTAGKLDRASLPARCSESPPVPTAGPRTPTERRVAEVWSALLGGGLVGRDDNFFDVGGHSLLLVHAHAQLQNGVPGLSLLDLYRYPTLRSVAAWIDVLAAALPTARAESA